MRLWQSYRFMRACGNGRLASLVKGWRFSRGVPVRLKPGRADPAVAADDLI